MARVLLVTTGKMEAKVLHVSLGRLFPDHDFHAWPRIDGFTSVPLPLRLGELGPGHRARITDFAQTLVGRLQRGRKDPRAIHADFVVGIDDLELCNAENPNNVVDSLRGAVTDVVAQSEGSARARLTSQIQTRCSFHLMAPMTEAYFFADPAALVRATAPGPNQVSRFDPDRCDVERFRVFDDQYTNPPTLPKSQRGPNDWRCDGRDRHPKHYLEFLTDAQLAGAGRYEETSHGCEALSVLDWLGVIRPRNEERSAAFARFARSLLADLVDMLGVPASHPELADIEPSACQPLTWPPPREPLLRNL